MLRSSLKIDYGKDQDQEGSFLARAIGLANQYTSLSELGTGLAIKISSHIPCSDFRVDTMPDDVARDSAGNESSTYVSFRFIGSRIFPARCIEYVHGPRPCSRS
ncbi:hypothetical protein TNCV_1968471 [Trichonephila clavipes]|nr:hypothetical protein TNCV_1968471 [Trichonephila clavipes]